MVWGIAVADVNGDGNQDLITANFCLGRKHCDLGVSVILGNGDGTFQRAVQYHTKTTDMGSVALADVNGDGHLDILYSRGTIEYVDNLAVLLGNGDGTFQQAQFYDSGINLVAADVNGDGRPDVLGDFDTGMEVAINNTGPHQPSTTRLPQMRRRQRQINWSRTPRRLRANMSAPSRARSRLPTRGNPSDPHPSRATPRRSHFPMQRRGSTSSSRRTRETTTARRAPLQPLRNTSRICRWLRRRMSPLLDRLPTWGSP
jgi:hypothetical protein